MARTLSRISQRRLFLSFSLPTLFAATMSTAAPPQPPPNYPTYPFRPPPAGSPYPYTSSSFTRLDDTPDASFYSTPRFVTHIDAPAIARLRTYYAHNLPARGRILDLCSSWVSHFPLPLEEAAAAGARQNTDGEEKKLEVVGLGMNKAELDANPLLRTRILHDLNASPSLPAETGSGLDATVCVVSIDYLTRPVEVLRSVLERTKEGGTLHLVISNRCFPTKVVGKWLQVGERERLEMVAGYAWWAGWRGVEVVDVVEENQSQEGEGRGGVMGMVKGWVAGGGGDPLWVVRGVKMGEGEARGRGEGHEEL